MRRIRFSKSGFLKAVVVTSVLSAISPMTAPTAYAQEATKRFNVPAQPLNRALLDLGRQAGISIAAPRDATRGKSGRPVIGEMSVQRALDMLLAGSGLKFTFLSNDAVKISQDTGANGQSQKAATSGRAAWPPGMAVAQEIPGVNAEDSSSPADEIIVTAQRRAESVQDVPISIAAFTGEIAESAGAINLTDLNGLAPNVVLQTEGLVPNIPMIAIRGMSSSDPDPNADPKVSTMIDGVYVPFAAGTMLDMFDIERVEILKGPQGVLFGKNNLAGTINIITARPTDDLGVEMRATVGSFGLKQLRGKYNSGKFANDTLAAKIAFNVRDYNGYSRNAITGNKLNANRVGAWRGALEFEPSDSFDSTIIVDGLKEKVVGPAPHTVDNGDPRYDLLPKDARDNIRVAAVNFDPFSNTSTVGVAWESNLYVGEGTITANLGYRELDYLTRGDFDGLTSPEPGLDVTRDFEGDSKSAELRYASPADKPIDFVVGVYFAEDSFSQLNTTRPAPPVLSLSTLDQKSRTYAAFALVSFDISEQLTLSAGGRYTKDKKDYAIDARVFSAGKLVAASSFADTYSDSWDTFTPRLGVEFRPNDDLMAYGTFSTGYKAGGYNSRGTVRENVGPYDPEKVDAFEVGFKSELFNRLLRFNVAAFYNKYRDLQSAVTKQGAVREENITVNIARAKTYGVELDLYARLAQGFRVGANAAWLKAKYTDFCADTDGIFTNGADEPGQCGPAEEIIVNGNPTGKFAVPTDGSILELANAPEWSGSVYADYEVPIGFGVLGFHADARYTDRYNTWGRSLNSAFYRDEVVLMNARVSIGADDDAWKLTLYGRNLTDQEVMSGAISAGTSPIQQFYQAPREWGVDLGFKF